MSSFVTGLIAGFAIAMPPGAVTSLIVRIGLGRTLGNWASSIREGVGAAGASWGLSVSPEVWVTDYLRHIFVWILGLWHAGDIKLSELVSRRYTLDQINEGYQDLIDGKNIRGVITHEH